MQEPSRHRVWLTGYVCAWIIALVGPALAGQLDPPAGPVDSTGRFGPRIELSQTTTPGDASATYRISQPGSYFLAGNLVGDQGKVGVAVAASGVTIDLRGFSMVGHAESGAAILAEGQSLHGLTIRNGTMIGWGGGGILAPQVDGARISSVQVVSVMGDGLEVGSGALIDSCLVDSCGVSGIICGAQSAVHRSTASGNQKWGIRIGDDARIEHCTASKNNGDGFLGAGEGGIATDSLSERNGADGFRLGGSWSIAGCVASDNDTGGFRVRDRSILFGCISTRNGMSVFTESTGDRNVMAEGFVGAMQCMLIDCIASENVWTGIDLGASSRVVGCLSSSNRVGIRVDRNCILRECIANGNRFPGIVLLGEGSSVEGCRTSSNGHDGFSVTADGCRIERSTSSHNAGAGIFLWGECVVDSNYFAANLGPDIQFTGDRNVIVRNTLLGMGIEGEVLANVIGPLVSGANIATNSNPHANYGPSTSTRGNSR